jgi:hypothetical protein
VVENACISVYSLINDSEYNWLAASYYTLYRITIKRTDVNDLVLESPPTGPVTIYNNDAGSRCPVITIILGDMILEDDTIKLYRTIQQSSLAALGDTNYLSTEHIVTSTDISNGYIVINDIIEDDSLGANLYINVYQEGNLNVNGRPPVAKCISY